MKAIFKFALGICFIFPANGSVAQQQPNIILIVSDDQGYNDVGAFGGDIHTPALDRLAREGIKATNFYVTAPTCGPSRGGIMTGRYPQRNGIYDNIRDDLAAIQEPGNSLNELRSRRQPEATLGMDLSEITLGDMLKKAGYTNGIIGKWDAGSARRFLPLQRGFDDFFGIVNTGVDYWTHERYGKPSLYRNNEPVEEEGFLVHLEGREVQRFIHENHDRPFFLYYPTFAPHGASNLERSGIRPPREYLDLYPDMPDGGHGSPKEHKATISAMDKQIGEMLNLLDKYGIADNTLVIFFPDQGALENSGDNSPFRGGKGWVFEGGVRSPFIARWPGVIPEGSSTDAMLSSLDLMPTLAEVANTWVPDATMDGHTMLPILKGETDKPIRKEMFWEHAVGRAARVGDYKWVDSYRGSGERGLYNLANDAGEEHDLSEELPDVLEDVKARWYAWKREMDNADPRGPFRNY